MTRKNKKNDRLWGELLDSFSWCDVLQSLAVGQCDYCNATEQEHGSWLVTIPTLLQTTLCTSYQYFLIYQFYFSIYQFPVFLHIINELYLHFLKRVWLIHLAHFIFPSDQRFLNVCHWLSQCHSREANGKENRQEPPQ